MDYYKKKSRAYANVEALTTQANAAGHKMNKELMAKKIAIRHEIGPKPIIEYIDMLMEESEAYRNVWGKE